MLAKRPETADLTPHGEDMRADMGSGLKCEVTEEYFVLEAKTVFRHFTLQT